VAALWLLNLDAELECDGRASPTSTQRSAVDRFRPAARALLAPGDVEWSGIRGEGRGRMAAAWCATPRAHALLGAAGADTSDLCPATVVRAVLSRAFARSLRADGEMEGFVRTPGELDALLTRGPGGSAWLAKREFSLAGRGRRRLCSGALTAQDRAWIAASFARGGLQVEPWYQVQAEFALHGLLGRDGRLHEGRLCRQVVDAHGSWLESAPAREDELDAGESRALRAAFGGAARALREAGYHGPFGIDAFRHAHGSRALSELNARHSMGWAVGFGLIERLVAPAREVAP
jgi:hypothetical protein